MTEGVQRDLGRFEAQINAIVKKLDQLDRDVRCISQTLAEAKGGWRTLMWVSGASAAISGFIVKFFPFTWSLPK